MAQKTSPVTPLPSRQSKTTGSEESKVKSPSLSASQSPKTKSPKPIEKKASRSPVSEVHPFLLHLFDEYLYIESVLTFFGFLQMKHVSRVSKLESQLSQVVEDLKKTKDLLNSSESSKVRALEEANEAKKQYMAMAADFEDTKRQLSELFRSDIDQSLAQNAENKIESENVDHAINEIENLKLPEAESEAESNLEVWVQEKSEADYQGLINETQIQIQVANSTIKTLHSDGLKVVAAFKAVSSEVEASKRQISSLENVSSALRSEVDKLKSALEGTEIRLKEEQIQRAVQLSSADETVSALKEELEKVKSSALESTLDANAKISELTANSAEKTEELSKVLVSNETLKREVEKLKASDAEVSELKSDLALLKAELTDRENELLKVKLTLEEVDELKSSLAEKDGQLKDLLAANERLKEEFEKLTEDQTAAELKESLMDKETELQSISEENKMLKMELQKKEEEEGKALESILAELGASKSSEIEKTRQLERAEEEAQKSNQRASKLTEQLESTRATNSEMEVELKRMRIQTEQWRKAAEAAAAILSAGSNGKVSEKSGPIEGEYLNFGGKVLSSPYSDEMDEETAAKSKKNNVLKKLGVLWKKGHK